jgi:hypothetical protein
MSQETSLGRERAAAFVDGCGRAWERWEIPGLVDLFSDEVVYVAHATDPRWDGTAPQSPAEALRDLSGTLQSSQ